MSSNPIEILPAYYPLCSPDPPPSYSSRSSCSAGAVSTTSSLRSSVQSREAGERGPLLPNQLAESNRSSDRWVLKDPKLLVIAALLFIFFFQSSLWKSKLTSSWVDITPDPMCSAIGARQYTATLSNIPEDWDNVEACMKTSFYVHGKAVSTSPICTVTPALNSTTIVQGRWIVDFDESDCVPVWSAISSECSSYGMRTYQADIHVPPGLDALASCKATPAIIQEKKLYPECELARQDDGTLVAKGHWNIPDTSCAPQWVRVTPHACYTYDQKRYTAVLDKIPHEMDPLKTCFEAPLRIPGDTGLLSPVYYWAFGIDRVRKPDSCGWDGGGMVGTWYLEHSDCRPTLISMQRYGCVGSGLQRFESEVADFGPYEEWYHLCTAIPYQWWGKTYLPVKCESRKSWGKTRRYVLYDIPTDQCA